MLCPALDLIDHGHTETRLYFFTQLTRHSLDAMIECSEILGSENSSVPRIRHLHQRIQARCIAMVLLDTALPLLG